MTEPAEPSAAPDAASDAPSEPALGTAEFVAMLALVISLVALSIDAMLPALPAIGASLGVRNANDPQLVISAMFLGFAGGQVLFGPISDSLGRKPTIYLGIGLFLLGTALCALAQSFTMMLVGRVVQGLGGASPRVVSIALVRDQYQGNGMARIMSMIMAVFILVPAIAPTLGQGILYLSGWRAIFVLLGAQALVAVLWLGLRQPETLAAKNRIPLSPRNIASGIKEVCTNRIAMGYTATAGLIFGAFIGFLTSAQQIFQGLYGAVDLFPLYFAILALSLGVSSIINSRLVMRFGMRPLATGGLVTMSLLALVYLGVAWTLDGTPPLWSLMIYLISSFFCVGLLFGNVNAMAMEPLGHIAGIGAAVIGSLSTFLSLILGTIIGQSYNDTVLPLIAGYALLALASLAVMRWTERGGPSDYSSDYSSDDMDA